MYAIVNILGKQYKVQANDVLTVDKLSAQVNEEVSFPVLMLVDGDKVKVGTPEVKNVMCKAKVVGDVKDKKLTVFKYKAKKNERKKQGHRQPYSKIAIVSIG